MNKYKLFYFIIFFSVAMFSRAQNLIEDDLKIPIEKALSKSSDVHLKGLQADMTEMEMEAVRAKRFPQLSLMGGYGYLYSRLSPEFPTQYLPITQTPVFEDPLVSNFQTQVFLGGISARQVIFAGNQINQGIKALEEKQKAEKFLAEAGKEEIIKEVIQTFDQLMLLKQADKLLEDSEKRLNKEHQKVLKAIENGLAIPYDRDKLKLAILELEEKKMEAEGNRALLYAKLQYLTDMEESELRNIDYELQLFLINHADFTPENRAEIKALESGRKASEHAYKKEKGSNLPTIFAFGNLNYVDAFDSKVKFKDVPIAGDVSLKTNHIRLEPAAAAGVGLKWDLFKGGANRKNIRKAEISLEMSEVKLKDTREKLELLLQKNRVDYNTAEKRVLVADQQLQIAENNLNLASKQYSAGLVDLTERLASENDFYQVNLNYYNQILNQRNAAIELLLGVGELWNKIFDEDEN